MLGAGNLPFFQLGPRRDMTRPGTSPVTLETERREWTYEAFRERIGRAC